MLVIVSSCGYVYEYPSVALILVNFDGVLNKCLIPDNGFWMMCDGGNNYSMLFESEKKGY